MTFINSRLVVSLFIFLVSLGAAYATLHPFSHGSAHDPARRLHMDLNDAFATHWKGRTGVNVSIRLARNKSGEPVHALVDGLNIITLALSYDKTTPDGKPGIIPLRWQPLPRNSSYASPYTSTIVFLVRKGNPKGLSDWDDLVRSGTEVITSNPKYSENGRWSYLAAWGYALKQSGGDEAAALEFVKRLFANIKPSDSKSGKRDATAAFVEQGLGDVLLVWENEAHLLTHEKGEEKFEIIVPPVSIVAERPISVIANGGSSASDVAVAYIDYLYTHPAQDIAAKHYYRPRDTAVSATYADRFPATELFTIDDVFGGWHNAEKVHFARGGVLEQIQSN
ncbi:sulfate ABC transporter substrate-binding protein [Nitrosovibrio tenuis]|uniref:Sulfate transport system substrate-binding protein n=1 Tax=Nitrosovibrio tenuis TaxID=1233 RepID=A0A1H7IDT9_9PROT|nr:sulfate ABC transporter substrate-binding protein [Nitrosovibrio tenuis]SEK60666.1 sulfate transport system substrate-binding protein [Nitrosovibrio tenuis]